MLKWIFIQQCVLALYIPYVHSQEDLLLRMRRVRRRLKMIEKQILTSNIRHIIKSKTLADRGIVNKGLFSEQAVERQLYKAIRGWNVTLFIFGESVSVGADLGKHNKDLVFHNILSHWWSLVFQNITDSKMMRHNLAIGGVGTSYFGRCWQEYLKPSDNFDLAVWEFNINDVGDSTLLASLEYFAQSLYKRFKKLDLVFTIFFRRSFFDHESDEYTNEKRQELAENIVAKHAHHYNLTCFNIEPLLNHTSLHLGVKELFRNMHPSAIAHSQMAFLMINYYTDIMIDKLDKWLGDDKFELSQVKLEMPKSTIRGNKTCQEICWTAVTPNFYKHIQAHSLFNLPTALSKEFKKISSGWTNVPEKRYDITGGYRASIRGAHLNIHFPIRSPTDHNLSSVSVALKYLSKKSITLIELDRVNLMTKTVAKYSSQVVTAAKSHNALTVYPIGNLLPGIWSLKMKVVQGDVLLCAIIIC